MGSRVVFRSKKQYIEGINFPACLSSSLSSLNSGGLDRNANRKILHQMFDHGCLDANGGKKKLTVLTLRENLWGFSAIRSFKFPSHGISVARDGYGRPDFVLPLGVRWLCLSIQTGRTATASKLNTVKEEGRKDKKRIQVKEASPEECDQAVEGLSAAKEKAKAKAKQSQNLQETDQSIMEVFWVKLLGIGPALRAVASMSRSDWAIKLRHWKHEFVSTFQHYWLGLKLLWVDVRISCRLLFKLAGGKGLSRRERQQLTRTTADIFRLVPVAVFIVVPFMELLLPVFLKLFPNMLPSTFQDKMKEQEALKRRLNARIEYARFLQDTVQEMAKEVQISSVGEIKRTAEDLDEFLNKVRTGEPVSNDEILNFAKLFNDELTLDNISRPRLVNMCKYMGVQPYGTDNYLRYMLRRKLQQIKNDDILIQSEGVESLSDHELHVACRERGYLRLLSTEEMRQQLRDWLDLSLSHSVPSSLLILSRAFIIPGKIRPEEAVVATLSSLPDEVVDTVGTGLQFEDSISERRRKLEFLEMQEELIKEEEKYQEKEEKTRLKESGISQDDLNLKELTSTATPEEELIKAKTSEKQADLSKVSRALGILASASSVSRERHELLRLVNKEIELYNTMLEKKGTEGEEDANKLYRAAREEYDRAAEAVSGFTVSSTLINKVDAMIQKLEKEINDVDAKIGNRWQLLDRDGDGIVTPEEVAAAVTYLNYTVDREGIQELINNLSKDREGKILVEDIVKLGTQSDDTHRDETERL